MIMLPEVTEGRHVFEAGAELALGMPRHRLLGAGNDPAMPLTFSGPQGEA